MKPPGDIVIPIVFPNYLITVDTPSLDIEIPVRIPGVPSHIRVPPIKERVPYLGHAGTTFFDGLNGITRYFEYGRYDLAGVGVVRGVPVPDLRIVGGMPTEGSLKTLVRAVSALCGQRGPILGAYIELKAGAFNQMLTYCQERLAQNNNPRRTPYNLITNSCCHFMRDVAIAGGARMPPVVPPEPSGYIKLVRSCFPGLDYTPPSQLTVRGINRAHLAAPAVAR